MADYCDVGNFNCKYCHDGDCDFFYMGSGNAQDMPCIVNEEAAKCTPIRRSEDRTIVISEKAFKDMCNECIKKHYGRINLNTQNILYLFSDILRMDYLFPDTPNEKETENNE